VLSPIVVAITSMIVGRKMASIGYRRLLIAGPMIMASTVMASVLFLHTNPTPWFPFLPIMFFLGIGLGATFPALSACTIMRLPQNRFAVGSAINNTFRQVGAAVGVALVVTVQSQTEGIEGFRNGWKVAIGFALAAAAVSIFQPNKANQLA
jgi:MFS family permease